jgi:GT2 family glycosyltransferase
VLSIIVPARNNHDFTASCLGTILHSVTRLNLSADFILIDDASDPDERILDVFRQHRTNALGHSCKIVRSHKHQHYSGAFSIGLNLAARDVIFFISNDMFVTPTFMEGLLLVSSLSRDFGIVRGTSNYADSHPEHVVTAPEATRTYQEIEVFSKGVFNANAARFTEDRLLSGDAILLKRALVERIGVLDLRFFGFFGDVDYGMRAHLAGFKMVCAKGAWLYHEGSGHVKREIERMAGATWDTRQAARMKLVDAAYQEFRKKWNIEQPASFGNVRSLRYFELARANAERVSLKYEFPSSVANDLEFF